MLAPNSSYSISSLAALREVNTLTSPMTKTQAESVLASFVAKGWLLKSKYVVRHWIYLPTTELHPLLHRKGRFSLSPRTLLELQPYLKSTYPEEVVDCTICLEVRFPSLSRPRILKGKSWDFNTTNTQILTRGHACPRSNCPVRMHNACYERYRRSSGKCPACSEDWGRVGNDRVLPIGEAAAPKDDWSRRTRRSVTTAESEDNEEQGAGGDDGDDDDDGPVPDQAAEAASQAAPTRRTQRTASAAR
jgi:non-structural maintenance of chromosomes element 1